MTLHAFDAVVTTHGPTVLRVCRAIVGAHDADDAWSETFLAALRAYPALPPGSDVRAWLITIAHHKAIDLHRARRRRPVPVPELPERTAGDGVPGSEDQPELWAAVAALPPTQRRAVAYRHLGGLPYREIAVLLGNSEAAARRAAADGVRTLRRIYRTDPS